MANTDELTRTSPTVCFAEDTLITVVRRAPYDETRGHEQLNDRSTLVLHGVRADEVQEDDLLLTEDGSYASAILISKFKTPFNNLTAEYIVPADLCDRGPQVRFVKRFARAKRISMTTLHLFLPPLFPCSCSCSY